MILWCIMYRGRILTDANGKLAVFRTKQRAEEYLAGWRSLAVANRGNFTVRKLCEIDQEL